MTLEQAIAEWKELNIDYCEIEFNCGGDSMNDTEVHFYSNMKLITNVSQELSDYFEDEMYKHCEFYVNSDGHYIGESGTVTIKFVDEDEDELYFTYSKTSTAEYSENFNIDVKIDLTQEQADYLNANVSNIFGSESDIIRFIYKRDFILTDNDEKIEKDLKNLIENTAEKTYPDVVGELQEWYRFSTDEDEGIVIGDDNILNVVVNRSVITYSEADW